MIFIFYLKLWQFCCSPFYIAIPHRFWTEKHMQSIQRNSISPRMKFYYYLFIIIQWSHFQLWALLDGKNHWLRTEHKKHCTLNAAQYIYISTPFHERQKSIQIDSWINKQKQKNECNATHAKSTKKHSMFFYDVIVLL